MKSTIRRLRKLWQTSWADRLLFAEAVVLTALARLSVLVLPWKRVSERMGQHMQSTCLICDVENNGLLLRVGWAVAAADRHVPWQAKCLVQAIAARWMLARRGVEGTIYLGMLKTPENEFKSHAWMRCGRRIVTGRRGYEPFTVVSTFAFGPENQHRPRHNYELKKGEPNLGQLRRIWAEKKTA